MNALDENSGFFGSFYQTGFFQIQNWRDRIYTCCNTFTPIKRQFVYFLQEADNFHISPAFVPSFLQRFMCQIAAIAIRMSVERVVCTIIAISRTSPCLLILIGWNKTKRIDETCYSEKNSMRSIHVKRYYTVTACRLQYPAMWRL